MNTFLGMRLDRSLSPVVSVIFLLLAVGLMLASTGAQAVTYANAATTFSWINASAHTQVGAHTTPYQFRTSTGGCGTTAPIIDDSISDIIPIGFNFVFGDKVFDSIRIMSNGRIHFVSTTLPLDNTTCGYGSPVTQLPYANATLTYTMRIYGNDMDPTLLADYGGNTTPCASSATCFISFAMIGAAPNRQFVVTWNNIPEWANFTSATGNYNLQIILNEAGDFIYQYGADVAGPQATLGQVGWEISTADFDTPAVGYPVANTAIHFFIPHPVVEYLMEQTSWSGAGSVLDTSGNSKHGAPLGAAQTTASGKVCRGASIPSSLTGANAINSGLVVPGVIGNAGTIAFWYKANMAWTGTSDALLLDATTVNNQWFFLVRRSNGTLRFGITDSTGTVRIAQTGAITVAALTWKHIAVTWNFNNLAGGNNDRLTIFVDGVQQAQTTFTSTTATLSSQIGTLYIGGSRNSLAETNSTVKSADATLDEFRVYNYEAKQALVATIMNLNAGGCLNHYAITDAGTGLACQLSQFTFTAHTSSHAAFTNNALVTLSTSDGTGTWSLLNGHGFLTNVGSNTGNATYLYNNESQVLLGLTHPTAATVTAHVTDGTYSEQENTALVISNCAVGKFNACEVASPRCTPTTGSTLYANLYTKLANTAFAIDVVAVKANGTLDTNFKKSVTVNLLANTTAPTINATSNCPTSQTATIPLGSVKLTSGRPPVGGVNVAATAFSSVSPNYSAYRDVRVQFVCSKANCGTAGTWCATDAFTVRPQSFTTITSSANADNAGASATSTPVVKAGAAFTITANTATAGYNGTPSIDNTKLEWLTAPVGGGVGTVVGSPTPAVLLFATAPTISTGNGASGNFTYSEVGYFRLQAGGVVDSGYTDISQDWANQDCVRGSSSNTLTSGGMYGCNIANQTATNYFGRFIPDHFAVTSPLLTPGCVSGNLGANSFTYMGQPFTQTASIEAQGPSGKTQNYSGIFARGTVAVQAKNANDGVSLGSRLTFTAPWTNGASAFSATQFSRPVTATPDATWGPYDTLSIGASVTDPDGVLLINRDMDQTNAACTADTSGTSNGNCTAVTMTTTKARYGRTRMQNAYGSELLDLPVVFRTEYWNTTGWTLNGYDVCSNVTLAFAQAGATNITGNTCVLEPGNNSGKGCAVPLTAAQTNRRFLEGGVSGTDSNGNAGFAGNFNLWLRATGATHAGSIDITATVDSWLQYPWSGAAAVNPYGRATFGIYKSPLIYRRENY